MRAQEPIDVAAWRMYLAAFDELLEARKRRDAEGARFARRVMLRELFSEAPAVFYKRRREFPERNQ